MVIDLILCSLVTYNPDRYYRSLSIFVNISHCNGYLYCSIFGEGGEKRKERKISEGLIYLFSCSSYRMMLFWLGVISGVYVYRRKRKLIFLPESKFPLLFTIANENENFSANKMICSSSLSKNYKKLRAAMIKTRIVEML